MLSIRKLKYGAAAAVIASLAGLNASDALAQAGTATINPVATVDNDFTFAQGTAMTWGPVAVKTQAAGIAATMQLPAGGGALVPGGGDANNAIIDFQQTAPTAGSFTIMGAAGAGLLITVTVAMGVFSIDHTISGESFTVTDLAMEETGDANTNNGDPNAADVALTVTTDAGGVETIDVGLTIEANTTVTYPEGTYTMTIPATAAL